MDKLSTNVEPDRNADSATFREGHRKEKLCRTKPSIRKVKDGAAAEPSDHTELKPTGDEPKNALELDLKRRLGEIQFGIQLFQVGNLAVHFTTELGPLGKFILRGSPGKIVLEGQDLLFELPLLGDLVLVDYL